MSSPATDDPSITRIEDDLDELSSLLWETFRGLKQASPPPQELRDAASRAALGPRHMPTLVAVAITGSLSVSDLARRLGLGLSTTSAIVGQLSRAGLLQRSEDERDHRRTIVRLHDEYREVISSWALRTLAPLRRTLELLPPPARADFMLGWRLLHAQATGTPPAEASECHDATA